MHGSKAFLSLCRQWLQAKSMTEPKWSANKSKEDWCTGKSLKLALRLSEKAKGIIKLHTHKLAFCHCCLRQCSPNPRVSLSLLHEPPTEWTLIETAGNRVSVSVWTHTHIHSHTPRAIKFYCLCTKVVCGCAVLTVVLVPRQWSRSPLYFIWPVTYSIESSEPTKAFTASASWICACLIVQ